MFLATDSIRNTCTFCKFLAELYLKSFLSPSFRFMEHRTQLLPGDTEDRTLPTPQGEACTAQSQAILLTLSPLLPLGTVTQWPPVV